MPSVRHLHVCAWCSSKPRKRPVPARGAIRWWLHRHVRHLAWLLKLRGYHCPPPVIGRKA